MAVHLVARDDVADQLIAKGCEPMESPIADHSAWRSPWGDSFLVPECGDEARTPDWKLRQILDAIDKAKPHCN